MKTTKLMPKIITEILTAHGKSLDDADLHLRLEMSSYMPLVIERIDVNRISVAHYYEQNGDLIADPDMTFYIYNGFWIVSEIQEPWGYRMCSEQTFTGWKYNHSALKDATVFANQWARNLREQGWATRATKGE